MFRSKEKDKLFVLLLELAGLLKQASQEFEVLKSGTVEDTNAIWKRSEQNKEQGQILLNQVMKELDLSLITPIEREDILHLAERLANGISSIEACAARFDIYCVTTLNEHMVYFESLINETSTLIYTSVEKLTQKKFGDMQMDIQKIYGQVEAAQQLERRAIKELFSNRANDPIVIIQEKEIYEYINRITRQQEKIAKVLGTIIMKNA